MDTSKAALDAFNQPIIEEFRANKGVVGGPFEGATLLLLTTTGAKSGEPRLSPLAYLTIDDKMIIVGLQPGELGTVYRMRAILANMTTMSRLSPFFQERTVAEDANFFDLLKLLGFQQITITDGDKVTHQVDIR